MSSLNAMFLITHLSSIISKCSIYDSPCLTSLTQIYATTVIPGGTGYGIESLDPMILDTISGDRDGLNYEMSDMEISGFKHTLIDKVQFHKDLRHSNIKLHVPNLTVFSNYTLKGFVYSVPFNGDGKLLFELFDVGFDIDMNYDIVRGNDGKEYIKYLNEFTYWYDMRYCETFVENLNKDDPVKAAEAQEIIKRECNILWQHYGRGIFDKVVDKIVDTIRKVLLIVPAENIMLDFN